MHDWAHQASAGRRRKGSPAGGGEDAEVSLVEREDVAQAVAAGEYGDRGVGEADREIGYRSTIARLRPMSDFENGSSR